MFREVKSVLSIFDWAELTPLDAFGSITYRVISIP